MAANSPQRRLHRSPRCGIWIRCISASAILLSLLLSGCGSISQAGGTSTAASSLRISSLTASPNAVSSDPPL